MIDKMVLKELLDRHFESDIEVLDDNNGDIILREKNKDTEYIKRILYIPYRLVQDFIIKLYTVDTLKRIEIDNEELSADTNTVKYTLRWTNKNDSICQEKYKILLDWCNDKCTDAYGGIRTYCGELSKYSAGL